MKALSSHSKLTEENTKNLKQVLGTENFSIDKSLRELFSQDIWSKGETADFVVSPKNTNQLSEAVKIAARHNICLNPRGGGKSYTNGYTPSKTKTGILDFSKMDKILEINSNDMYVTVQSGCTWKTLYEALKPLGLRTPFWGPLSGFSSTIGGGTSNNNAFFGSGLYGTSTQSVTSITVVLADGKILKTGTAGSRNAKPFYRHYGPDLTGLFMGDSGALAYKAEVTLRLIPLPRAEGSASFEYENSKQWVEAQMEMGRLGLASELYGFDPNLQAVRMKRASLVEDFKSLKNVITKEKGGFVKGLKEGTKVALAGRSYMDDVAYSVHFSVEGHSDAEVEAKINTLKEIAKNHGGNEIENSIPKIIRANPFTPLNNIIGPQGERWVPIHGIVSMGDGLECLSEIEAFFDSAEDKFEAHDIQTGFLLTTMSTNGFLIEPVFTWPEEIWPIHEQTIEASTLKRIKRFKSNPKATKIVDEARHSVLEIFSKYGAAHFQIGRTYPYREDREETTWNVLEGIKSLLDSNRTINSGALGLE